MAEDMTDLGYRQTIRAILVVWNPTTLKFERMVQPATGAAGGGGDASAANQLTEIDALGDILAALQATLTVNVDNMPADPATDTTLASVLLALQNRYSGGKTPYTATITAADAPAVLTPAAGKALRVFYVKAINDPDSAATPLITATLGAAELYRDYVIAHWEIFEGAADQPLTIAIASAGTVAVTVHYQEFTP